MKFYSKYAATKYVMSLGVGQVKTLQFHGGEFETTDRKEIEELMAIVRASQEVISLEPQRLMGNDAHLLREVGRATTGSVNSQILASLAASSNAA